jgi:hypothetical protein
MVPWAVSRSNAVWAFGQIEVETGRLQLHLEKFARAPSTESLDALHERMDVLWSRAFMSGWVGERINAEGGHVLDEFRTDLEAIDPIVAGLTPDDPGQVQSAIDRLEPWPSRLRPLTLGFLRSESAAASERQSRIETSARTLELSLVIVSAVALALIAHGARCRR